MPLKNDTAYVFCLLWHAEPAPHGGRVHTVPLSKNMSRRLVAVTSSSYFMMSLLLFGLFSSHPLLQPSFRSRVKHRPKSAANRKDDEIAVHCVRVQAAKFGMFSSCCLKLLVSTTSQRKL